MPAALVPLFVKGAVMGAGSTMVKKAFDGDDNNNNQQQPQGSGEV